MINVNVKISLQILEFVLNLDNKPLIIFKQI